jgi:replication initiation and membrane attachment protein
MKELSPSDLFETRAESLFSSRDQDYLLDFYTPLIGIKAVALYEALLAEESPESHAHETFLSKIQFSVGEMVAALNALEAVGLVATYYQKGEKFNNFVYCLYAPKTPKEFLDNVLFVGTLRKYLDNDKIDALAKKYALLPPPSDFENVSESFRDYFAPDFDDPTYQESTPTTGGRKTGAIQTGFDKNAFLKALLAKDPRVKETTFSAEEYVKLARLAALYSYSEEAMADFVYPHLYFGKEAGNRIDFYGVEKEAKESLRFAYLHPAPAKSSEVHDDGALARTIRAMDNLTPVEFLSKLQKGNKPASSDLALLEELTVEMGLSAPLCNALVFYVITTKDGQLPAKYAEKIAASLMRKGIETSLDAMNYFSAGKKTYSKPAENEVAPAPVEAKPSVALTEKEGTISDAEFDQLMSELYTPKKEGK